jgi:transposase
MTMTQNSPVGIDVSKGWLDLAIASKVVRIDNTASAILAQIKRLRQAGFTTVGMEPTGGYERLAVHLFREAGFTVLMVDSWRCRQFAKARGNRAKTDPLDARLIADFLVAHEARPFPEPSAGQQELTLWSREIARAQASLLRLQNRLDHIELEALRSVIETEMEAIRSTVKQAQAAIEALIAADTQFSAKAKLLDSMTGIGPNTIRVLLAEMPELGHIDARKAAALAGVAPYPRDSGKSRGISHIEAGRDALRRALYLAAFAAKLHNPWAKAIYDGLRKAGKATKVALIALARRILIVLNAMARSQKPWQLNNKAS